MADVQGYVVLTNNFGSTVQAPKLTLNGQVVINETSINDGASSPEAQYYGAGDASDTWAVSFSADGQKSGTVNCNVTANDANQKLTVTLNATDFTVTPPVSASATGNYT